ncbi:hypothetical protein HMN09_00991700 [Mycena chlorophos]|uniref:Uncharacterized protein n=1 Tax=Mycena chlorophos TaxID=658473 RepID=A0A8H6SK88_MYCCL|nr:hypothetical protein HMN09_00991700 [Mycena chlorophos]
MVTASQFEAELRRDYPAIMNPPYSVVSVPTGWQPLIRRLCTAVQQGTTSADDVCIVHLRENPHLFMAPLQASFSIHTEGSPAPKKAVIEAAKAEAMGLCRRCGEEALPPVMRAGQGWLYTLCREFASSTSAFMETCPRALGVDWAEERRGFLQWAKGTVNPIQPRDSSHAGRGTNTRASVQPGTRDNSTNARLGHAWSRFPLPTTPASPLSSIMADRFETQLRRDFPTILRTPDIPFDLTSGRDAILRRLFTFLCNLDKDPNVRLSVVGLKEELSSETLALEISVVGGTSQSRQAVKAAQDESRLLCQRCGEDGRLARTGWWAFVMCQECMDYVRAMRRGYAWIEPGDDE